MYSKQDLSHVTKYDKYDRYSIDNRLGQYEGRVGKWKKILKKKLLEKMPENIFFRKNIRKKLKVFDTLYELRKKVKMD